MKTQKPPNVPSPDLAELKRLLKAGFRIQEMHLTIPPAAANSAPSVHVRLANDSIPREIQSAERDVIDYCARFHQSLDDCGRVMFRQFKDNNRYFAEAKHFGTNIEQKCKAVGERYNKGELRLGYDPLPLLTECLRSREWGAKRFLPLKRDHFEVDCLLLLQSRNLLDALRRLYEMLPAAKAHGEPIGEVLSAAWHKEDSFIKRALHFIEYSAIDVDDAIFRAYGERKHVQDLYEMVVPRTPVPAREGLRYLLEAYRRYCEVLFPFVRALSNALRVINNEPPLDPGTGYEKRIELIRNSKYAAIVDCVDLDIRHSESHTANTTIDDDKGQIVLTRLLNDGSRAVVRTYSYAQFTDMLTCMERGLLPAMLYEFGVVRFAILGTLMHSIEYVHLLLSIDNLTD